MIPLLLAAALLAWFLLYTADYYRADGTALQAMKPDGIRINRTDYGWYFDGPSETDALVFYPGGKVEETAYAPLLSRLAEDGIAESEPYRMLCEIAERLGVPYYNYHQDPRFFGDLSLFRDVDHLNENGASLYTRCVIHDILEKR